MVDGLSAVMHIVWRSCVIIFTDWWSGMSGALSIPLGVLAVRDAWSQQRIFAILAIASLLIMAWRLAYKCVPKLLPLCSPTVDGCHDTNNWENGRGGVAPVRFLRIKIETACLVTVKDCGGYLTEISKDGERLWGNHNAQLTIEDGDK